MSTKKQQRTIYDLIKNFGSLPTWKPKDPKRTRRCLVCKQEKPWYDVVNTNSERYNHSDGYYGARFVCDDCLGIWIGAAVNQQLVPRGPTVSDMFKALAQVHPGTPVGFHCSRRTVPSFNPPGWPNRRTQVGSIVRVCQDARDDEYPDRYPDIPARVAPGLFRVVGWHKSSPLCVACFRHRGLFPAAYIKPILVRSWITPFPK